MCKINAKCFSCYALHLMPYGSKLHEQMVNDDLKTDSSENRAFNWICDANSKYEQIKSELNLCMFNGNKFKIIHC